MWFNYEMEKILIQGSHGVKLREYTSTASLDGNDRRKQVCFKHTLLTLIGTVCDKTVLLFTIYLLNVECY